MESVWNGKCRQLLPCVLFFLCAPLTAGFTTVFALLEVTLRTTVQHRGATAAPVVVLNCATRRGDGGGAMLSRRAGKRMRYYLRKWQILLKNGDSIVDEFC